MSNNTAMVDGAMVANFVEDEEAFMGAVDRMFASLDGDGDSVLSRSELLKGLEGFMTSEDPVSPSSRSSTTAMETAVFEKFDGDGSGGVDRNEFRAEMREIMLAMARGIGDSPVHVMLSDDSFVARLVVEHHISKYSDQIPPPIECSDVTFYDDINDVKLEHSLVVRL